MSHRRALALAVAAIALLTALSPSAAGAAAKSAERDAAVQQLLERSLAGKTLRRKARKAVRVARSKAARRVTKRIGAAGPRLIAAHLSPAEPPRRCGKPAITEIAQPTRRGGIDLTGSAGVFDGVGGSTAGTANTWTGVADLGDGATKTVTQSTKDCITWDPCPAASGRVGGTGEIRFTRKDTTRVAGVEVTAIAESVTTVALEAVSGDDARVGSYRAVVDSVIEVRAGATNAGKVVAREPTRTYRVHSVRNAIDPRNPPALDRAADQSATRGPKGRRLDKAERTLVTALEAETRDDVLDVAARALLGAERHWADNAACARIELTPGTPQLARGAHAQIAGVLRAADGGEAPVASFTVSGLGANAGSGPIAFGYDVGAGAPTGVQRGGDVLAISRAGYARAEHRLDVTATEPRFAVTVYAKQHLGWTFDARDRTSIGTDSECDVRTTGQGRWDILALSREGDQGTAVLRNGELQISGVGGLSTTVDVHGTLTRAGSGPGQGCTKTVQDDTSGCVSDLPVPDVLTSFEAVGDDELEVSFSRWQRPDLDCPFQTVQSPEYISQDLLDGWYLPIPMAQLRDPSVPVVELAAAGAMPFHEDCTTEGSPGCTNDAKTQQSSSADVTRGMDVRVRLTRIL